MNILSKIIQNKLFKIATWNSFSVAIKIVSGLLTSKILAVFVGPSGMALVGNLRVFFTSLENISTLGFQNGIVKYVAEAENSDLELKKVLATVTMSLLAVAVVLSSVLYFLASYWNFLLFGEKFDFAFIIKVLAFSLPWYTISVFFTAVINGLGKYKKVIWINTIGNVLGFLLSIVLIINYKTTGALLALVLMPATLFFAAVFFANKEIAFISLFSWKEFDFAILKKLASYTVMTLATAVVGPFVYLAIRKNIILNLGLEQAGYWETMTRISLYYMMFVTTIISVYFLPQLATAKNNLATKKMFLEFYKLVLPLFIVAMVVLYCLRFYIIDLLFTPTFRPVAALFFWQLFGDIFKVAALILGCQFFAKKLTVAFLVTELFSLFMMFFLSTFLLKKYGIEGVVLAQAIDNIIYFFILLFYFRTIFKSEEQ